MQTRATNERRAFEVLDMMVTLRLNMVKLIWQWKITDFNREYIFKRSMFHCHVCLQKCSGNHFRFVDMVDMMNRNGYDELLMDMMDMFQVVKPLTRTSCNKNPYFSGGCLFFLWWQGFPLRVIDP